MAERKVPGTREPRGPRASPCAPSAEPGSSREDGKLGPEGPWPASSPQGGWAPLGTDRSRHSGSTAKRTRKGKLGVMGTRRLPQCWAGHGESRLQRRSNNSQTCKRGVESRTFLWEGSGEGEALTVSQVGVSWGPGGGREHTHRRPRLSESRAGAGPRARVPAPLVLPVGRRARR